MISQSTTLIRVNKLGKPYVQSTDPSLQHPMVTNDLWLNPSSGTMKMWNGTGWTEMQFGGSAIMDDCISNRMIANNISASKVTAGRLTSQDESFYLDLETGEAMLLNLILGGQVEGNIIATSSNNLTRVRLRGREGDRDVTAAVIFEERDDTEEDTDWNNTGQIYFAYNSHDSYSALQHYQIGAYNGNRPDQGYNGGSTDGLLWRAMSLDWLKANMLTYHGVRLVQRDSTDDPFTNVPSVINARGQCMDGTSVKCNGNVTCTYQMNEVMRLDFNIKITTAGSGTAAFGISPSLLRQLNSAVPVITPINGGTLQIFTSAGALSSSYVGATMVASGGFWCPAYMNSSTLTNINESAMAANLTLIGTCYGTYTV